jgi:heat shock protein HtpX
MEWKRDWGLTTRVWLTGLLLLLLYLVFMTVLLAFGVGYWVIVLLAVGMGLIQYFFSDKLVLWSTGSRVIKRDQ